MKLTALDASLIGGYLVLTLLIGLAASRRAGRDSKSFFLAGRDMPWWLLGVSMVATAFATDTPNLVTGFVRTGGVAKNWAWWSMLLTGMLTVFVYARLWRRTGVVTDIEFYELRYGGRAAAALRGFRALYLGLVFNVVVMATVSLAAVKLGAILLGWPGWLTLLVAGAVTLVYSGLGGLRAVILTDFVQFALAMVGAVWASVWVLGLPEIGGLDALLAHPNVAPKLSLLPDLSDPEAYVPVLLVPLAVQWWAAYYPGAEPGGGGYVAQRMFAARSEGHAVAATLLYNVAYYALRPWPWILVALASLVVFPDVDDLRNAFPSVEESKIGEDLAYPAMLSLLPPGLLGLVTASLLAAFMSTMSTQLNLGASYLVNDFWGRFVRPEATEAERVRAGRIATAVSLVLGSGLGLALTDAGQSFNILLLLGAGTGGLYVLRWFWWRVNAWTEIVAMVGSVAVAGYYTFGPLELADHERLVRGALVTTALWVAAAFVTPRESDATLQRFVDVVRPGGPGWSRFTPASGAGESWPVPRGLLSMLLGCVLVYGLLLGTGRALYGDSGAAAALIGGALLAGAALWRMHGGSARARGPA
ncbi:MAG: sodium:solute symporter family protein [Planctomycetota bacterium]